MTKQDSLILKGIAILFMIYGHLFLYPEWSDKYESMFHLFGLPIECLLTRATGPVSFYLLLGGYGMYYIYQNKGLKNNLPRIRNLYINFWVVLFLFVLIGHFIKPSIYPGSIKNFIYNLTGFNTTYNGEWWFLLPYSLVIASSYYIFKLIDKYNPLWIIFICVFGFFTTSFIISRFGAEYLYGYNLRYNLFLYFHLLWEFIIGAMLLKTKFFSISKSVICRYIRSERGRVSAIILLVLLRCCFDTSAVHLFYVIAFIALFLSITRWKFVDNCLSTLGKYSMNMWLIHTCICYYLFKDFIYGLKFPIIIYVVVVVLSLFSAVVVTRIAKIFIPSK